MSPPRPWWDGAGWTKGGTSGPRFLPLTPSPSLFSVTPRTDLGSAVHPADADGAFYIYRGSHDNQLAYRSRREDSGLWDRERHLVVSRPAQC